MRKSGGSHRGLAVGDLDPAWRRLPMRDMDGGRHIGRLRLVSGSWHPVQRRSRREWWKRKSGSAQGPVPGCKVQMQRRGMENPQTSRPSLGRLKAESGEGALTVWGNVKVSGHVVGCRALCGVSGPVSLSGVKARCHLSTDSWNLRTSHMEVSHEPLPHYVPARTSSTSNGRTMMEVKRRASERKQ